VQCFHIASLFYIFMLAFDSQVLAESQGTTGRVAVEVQADEDAGSDLLRRGN
jgi:hypothetical protein